MLIGLGGRAADVPWNLRSDAGLLILGGAPLPLFPPRAGRGLNPSLFDRAVSAEIEVPDGRSLIDAIPAAQPAAAPGAAAKIPEQKVVWEKSAAAGQAAGSESPITRLAVGLLDGPGKPSSILVGTASGALQALAGDGSDRWEMTVPERINDIAAADLDGDGRDDVVIARQDFKVTVFDPREGKWSRTLDFYRRPPHVNVVGRATSTATGRSSPAVRTAVLRLCCRRVALELRERPHPRARRGGRQTATERRRSSAGLIITG
jgi:hypothetical protein